LNAGGSERIVCRMEDQAMVPFNIHTIESAPEASKPLLAKLESDVGFIPNLAAAMAESPALFESFATLRAINGRNSSLTPVERELVAITAAVEYGCTYCKAAHSTFAAMLGGSESLIAGVRAGTPTSDVRVDALVGFTRHLIRRLWKPADDEVRSFMAAGFEPRQILDVFAVIAQVTIAAQTFLIAGTPLDAAFAARA
jgi:uncharacterized peroxidase-related enzyme